MNAADLHTHSTASDGALSPAELVEKAAGLGLSYLALTDHDTVEGIPAALEAARAHPRLTLVPGIELSTDIASGEVHILGYYVNFTSPALRVELERLRDGRQKRTRLIIEKLLHLGMELDWDRVREIAGEGSIGRPHIALAMQEKGYVEKFKDAFDKYIGQGCPAYVEREKLSPAEAVKIILAAGGIPVLAHPWTSGAPESVAAELRESGLIGLEAYYYEHSPEQTDFLLALANRLGLIVTGGSDFHGTSRSGGELGSVSIPPEAVNNLIILASELKSRG